MPPKKNMGKKKILITGGKGVLAGYVKKVFKDDIVFAPGHKGLDVTDKKAIGRFFKKHKPDIVIHLVAKTNVDECEKNPKEAFLVNSEGTKNMVEACKKGKAFLVYVSTAAVFNGRKDCFCEDDKKNPVNIYGQSKLRGEEYIQKILKDFLILRAGWLIGGGKKEKKFISYIVKQLRKKKKLEVVNDKFGTITHAKELADFIKEALEDKKSGVYHFGSRGSPSRFDIAKEIVSLLGQKVTILPVSSEKFKDVFFAPRPTHEVIRSKKIAFKRTWQESLKDYIRNELLK